MLIENAGGVSNGPPDAFIGSNGMVEAPDGSVWMVQHGARQIVRVGPDRTLTPVVSTFEGKRFNSPNDLVFAKDGALYFTDPPYGLAKQDDDPAKEIPFNGVYRFANGRVQALVRDLNRPNGLAFSPDSRSSTSTTPTRRRTSSCATTSPRTARLAAAGCSRTSPARSRASPTDSRWTRRETSTRPVRAASGSLAGRQAPRHHPPARGARQLRVGRRWQDAVHDRGHRRLPHQDAGRPLAHPVVAVRVVVRWGGRRDSVARTHPSLLLSRRSRPCRGDVRSIARAPRRWPAFQ